MILNYRFTVCLAIVLAVGGLLMTGCEKPDETPVEKPDDMVCTNLSEALFIDQVLATCTDGQEPQLCMSADSLNCGYYVNSIYIPCDSCTCDEATEEAVAVCKGQSP